MNALEVGGYIHECAWIKIYERLRKFNRMDLFTKYRPPRNFKIWSSPRFIDINKSYTNEEEPIKEEK